MNIDIGFSYKDTGKIVCRLTIVAVLLFSVCTVSAQTNAIRYSDYINNTKTAGKAPLSPSNDVNLLIQLSTEISPSIYLSGGNNLAGYGVGAPLVVYADVQSIKMLYAQNKDFNAVELLVLSLYKPDDEIVNLVLKNLTDFTSLKYLLLVYKYDSCGKNLDDCLKSKTNSIVTSESYSPVTVLYRLSVPQ